MQNLQEKAKKPSLRFEGFTDEWEQRKLGEVGKARSGVGFPDSEQGGNEGIPFFKVSDMNNDGNENEMITANNYVSEAQIAKHRWNPITETPAIFFAKVGAAVMLNRKRLCRFPFLLDNNTMAYSLYKDYWNADFSKALFETVDLTSLVQVGALPSYNAGDVESMEIRLPSVEEQQQIGNFFSHLDTLITLHQRKYAKLVNIKKSMLEKMFPKNGASVPEIRFPGFTDAWEQRKLSEVCQIVKGQQLGKAQMIENGQYYVLNGGISPSGFTNSYNTESGTISISEGGNSCGYVIFNTEKFWSGGHNYTLLNLKLSTKFLYQFLKSNEKTIMEMRIGSGLPNIQKSSLEDFEIRFPCEPEQETIGSFFRSLDTLITLHQRKLERLQNIKKSCLEKMFV